MEHSVRAPALRLRDRLSLSARLWRAGRTGLTERRRSLLGAAAAVAQGEWVAAVVDGPMSLSGTGAMGGAELQMFGGSVLDLGMCHRPTVVKVRRALGAGPVIVERLADHGHCWGVYLRTSAGPIGLLTGRLNVTPGHGGQRVSRRPLAFA